MSKRSDLVTLLKDTQQVYYPGAHPVEFTAATLLCGALNIGAPMQGSADVKGLHLSVDARKEGHGVEEHGAWMHVRMDGDGTGQLSASQPALLYALVRLIIDGRVGSSPDRLRVGLTIRPAFDWHRPLYDSALTQVARSTRRFDSEAYVRRLAECGFTHLEVNALEAHVPFEEGVPGEYYNQFYSYCAGLNNFVDSTLTRGLYPAEYLEANLRRLRRLADLGRRYGLRPGILCFEPRTLPERFFQRYPMLRGARVDHPFRSRLPRYTLAQDHPVSRDHYRQLMRNLLAAVPELEYMSVWTNDSGSGFEHTASLYVGRNGGPYMIREWRNHEKIAEAAGSSAVRWLRLIRESAAEINPNFEVLLRIEPFKVEHDTIIQGMGDGLSIEAPSLRVRGYHLPYRHPRYPEQESAAGTIFHTEMDPSEREHLAAYREHGFEPRLTYSASSSFNFEPLLGIPFPRMLHKKLLSLKNLGVRGVSAHGGLLNTGQTPYWPNPEIIRGAQLTPDVPIDELLFEIATAWAGSQAQRLVDLWDRVEQAVMHLPIVPLYSNFGFVWLRTWVRPLVPDIEAMSREERRYYERFLVSTANNPAINDLGRDVLFELISQESGERMTRQFDENVIPRLDVALAQLDEARKEPDAAHAVLTDLRDRTRALRYWAVTQRNTCAWVAGVYGYLDSEREDDRSRWEAYLQEMIDLDVENTRSLLDLWETSDIEFMLVSDVGETSFVYGDNLGELLRTKLRLTERYRHNAPRIDRDIIWRLE
jgi:hypothetical protein